MSGGTMAIIKPFRAYRYDTSRAGSLDDVLAPPYDVISPEKQRELFDANPNSIIRVDYRPDDAGADKYADAAKVFNEFVAAGILAQDASEAIYVTEDIFTDWEGVQRSRLGFICMLRVEELGKGTVYPHEKTFPKHKEDRRRLMRATGAQFNPIFCVYSDQDGTVSSILKGIATSTAAESIVNIGDGAVHTLRPVTDQTLIEKIQNALAPKPVFIADGHHRYETSLKISREIDSETGIDPSADNLHHYCLMYLVGMEDEGLVVMSTHRMLRNIPDFTPKWAVDQLSENFDMQPVSKTQAFDYLSESFGKRTMIMQTSDGFTILNPRESALETNERITSHHESLRYLNVTICQELAVKALIGDADNILDHVAYEVDHNKASSELESGKCQAVLYLGPVPVDEMTAVANAMQVMPHKSTYFYPKLLTGLVIHRFSDNNRL